MGEKVRMNPQVIMGEEFLYWAQAPRNTGCFSWPDVQQGSIHCSGCSRWCRSRTCCRRKRCPVWVRRRSTSRTSCDRSVRRTGSWWCRWRSWTCRWPGESTSPGRRFVRPPSHHAVPSVACRHWRITYSKIISKGAITSKIKHAIKLETSPARFAQLLHNCCSPR